MGWYRKKALLVALAIGRWFPGRPIRVPMFAGYKATLTVWDADHPAPDEDD